MVKDQSPTMSDEVRAILEAPFRDLEASADEREPGTSWNGGRVDPNSVPRVEKKLSMRFVDAGEGKWRKKASWKFHLSEGEQPVSIEVSHGYDDSGLEFSTSVRVLGCFTCDVATDYSQMALRLDSEGVEQQELIILPLDSGGYFEVDEAKAQRLKEILQELNRKGFNVRKIMAEINQLVATYELTYQQLSSTIDEDRKNFTSSLALELLRFVTNPTQYVDYERVEEMINSKKPEEAVAK